jgi:uncharacterized protein (TIGR02217 family)
MSNAVYPSLPGLTFPIERTPEWATDVQTSASGRDFTRTLYTAPRYRYKLSYEFLRDSVAAQEFRTLLGAFNARMGQWDTWLFSDPDDSSVTAQVFGTGNGSNKVFQLERVLGGFAEAVYDLNGAPSIYVGGVLKTAGTDYTISSTGLVTFTSAPAAAASLTWTGSYYWRCRFLSDTLDFRKMMAGFWELASVEFITCKA